VNRVVTMGDRPMRARLSDTDAVEGCFRADANGRAAPPTDGTAAKPAAVDWRNARRVIRDISLRLPP
jgi:hypothetical protein